VTVRRAGRLKSFGLSLDGGRRAWLQSWVIAENRGAVLAITAGLRKLRKRRVRGPPSPGKAIDKKPAAAASAYPRR